ncbi:MAG: glycosyltransferase family 2 protein [Salinivirgaceae bacterium]|jgi:glycosyltransferase involved in cell wall biosynthesis|nr:glycosyltransferase family 2 protein [Salinivirgaceae bacterium]
MIKLSVVIITFNEEKNIERCLNSVIDVADEIIVVDSFSTDKTKEICNSFNIRFLENKFDGYIQQRNFAAQQAKYDYVLSLDADESLSNRLKNSIGKVKQQFTADAFYFNRLNNYCGKWIKHSGWYPDKKLRLWDRRKGKLGGQNPHDRLIMKPGSIVKKLKGDLYHNTFSSIQEHISQIIRFTDIAALSAYKRGRRASIAKILLYPPWKFIRDYFFNAGFLDGYYGFVICSFSAFATLFKLVKIRELHTNQNK